MKYIICYLTILFSALSLMAQNEGTISYTETMKFELELDGIDESMRDLIPNSQSFERELLFNSTESLFRSKKGEGPEEVDISSDDGDFQLKIVMGDDIEDIFYKDFASKSIIHQRGLMGKAFLVKDELEKIKWKITGEKVMYMDYECQKAVLEEDDNFVVAWFTSQIPAQVGPMAYHGLPGAILMVSVNEGELEIKANKIELGSLDSGALKAPKEGKKVTQEEFEKIRIEKEKEMQEMYGGRGNMIIETEDH